MKQVWKYYLIALAVLFIDQATKLYVHFNVALGAPGQIKLLGNWLKIHYILNPGMAFGIQFGFKYGKVLLTIGRIIATVMIGRYIWRLAQAKKPSAWLLGGWALILSGAAGNGIDSTLYGVLLDNAPPGAPMTWFYGQVIDMIHLDLWSAYLPTWIPCWGGEYVMFFPIGNVADVAILVGVALILLAQQQAASHPEAPIQPSETVLLEA